jgi:hypothetical protein
VVTLDELREAYPDWQIVVGYITAASRPDARVLYAHRGAVTLTAFSEQDLARALQQSAGEHD